MLLYLFIIWCLRTGCLMIVGAYLRGYCWWVRFLFSWFLERRERYIGCCFGFFVEEVDEDFCKWLLLELLEMFWLCRVEEPDPLKSWTSNWSKPIITAVMLSYVFLEIANFKTFSMDFPQNSWTEFPIGSFSDVSHMI